jgi:hypothetical protein
MARPGGLSLDSLTIAWLELDATVPGVAERVEPEGD